MTIAGGGSEVVKFFVPYAADDAHAEQIWSDSRAGLFALGMPTTDRRIWALSFEMDGLNHLLHIGREMPLGDGPALIIFEASSGEPGYYVCTPWRGVLGGEPHRFGPCRHGRAIDFDESAEGNA
ncbi:MAG TPA: hypothetical protein VGB04_04620 [Allosphingosinicella sp.]